MSLLETDRIVRKIRDLLRGETDPALAPRLATDFADAVRATQLRLEQCETMIQAGDYPQAIQLAETAPNLLDMVTVLEFRESPEWRRFCQEKQLPVAEPLDSRAVQVLNECYAKGITTDHPLYKQFRKAMMSRDDTSALRALRSILRLNPNDQNAATELERLDAKVLEAQLTALQTLLDHGSSYEIQRAAEGIEEAGFKTVPSGPTWYQAQLRVALKVLERAEACREDGEWPGVIDLLDLLRSLVAEHKLTLPMEAAAQVASLDEWLNIQRERHRQELEFTALQATAWGALRACEDHAAGGKPMTTVEMEADLASLQRAWLALERSGKSLPSGLAIRLEEGCRVLEARLRTRRRQRLIALAAGFAVALGLLGSGGYFWRQEHRVQSITTELQSLVRNREVKAVEGLLQHLREREQRLLENTKLQRAEKESKEFVLKELRSFADYTNAFGQLPTVFKGDQLEDTQSKLKQAVDQLALLAPGLRAIEERRLEDFQARWSQFLETRRQILNGAFEPMLRELEQRVESIATVQTSGPVRSSVPSIAELVRNLNELVDVPSLRVKVNPSLRARFSSVRAKFETQRQQLDTYDKAVSRLHGAQNLEEFRDALASVSNSVFPMDKEAQAAMKARSFVPTEEDFLASLLLPNSVEAVKALKLNPTREFIPKAIRPEAMTLFQALRNQNALSSELVRYRLYLDVPQRTRQIDWITVGPLRKKTGWEEILAFPLNAGTSDFKLVNLEYSAFDGKLMRISPVQLVEVEEKGICREASSFQSLGLGQIFGGAGNTVTQPLLKVLDELRTAKEGSPLARAYLLLQITQLMEVQPADWGLPFAPIVRDWQRNLREAGADKIKPGDWFLLERIAESLESVGKTLGSLRPISCFDQANKLATLTALTVQNGMSLVGYVGLDGQPVLTSKILAPEIWGVSAEKSAPDLLYRSFEDGKRMVIVKNGLPMTPLFKLNESPSSLQTKAHINSDDKEFLPPLFKLATETP